MPHEPARIAAAAIARRDIDRGLHSSRWRQACCAALLVLLAACGGGGGDGGNGGGGIAEPLAPPTTGASIAATTAEAAESARAAAATADRVAERTTLMSGVSAAFGGPVGASALPPGDRKQALAVVTSPCSDVLDPPCSGTATLDTNISDSATRIVPGDYLDATFNDLRGRLSGSSLVLNGRMRMEFETTVDLNSTSLFGLSTRIKLDAFSASINGWSFGPVTETARLQIDSRGVSTITSGGLRYGSLSGVTVTSNGNYVVGSGNVRLAYWGSSSQYVDVTLTSWRVVSGRPAVGSQAAIVGASGSVTARVTASSTGSITYAVTITSGGRTSSYIVTATYPTSGSPTYTAVAG